MKTLILVAILLPSCASRTMEVQLPTRHYHSAALFPAEMRYQEQWKPTDDYPAP
tara:strand:+ start:34907 stop:35068 length:162 start_codon:yes stop_codon:yes gene_type:complete